MALWQYTFHILTRESFDFIGDKTLFSTEDYLFDDEPYWQYKPIDRSFFTEIELILDRGKSWSKNIDLYGIQDSNCFEVGFEQNNIVNSVSFRINFTSDYENILNQIIEFCILKKLIILDEELNVVPLDINTIKEIIKNAPQRRKYNWLLNTTTIN